MNIMKRNPTELLVLPKCYLVIGIFSNRHRNKRILVNFSPKSKSDQ